MMATVDAATALVLTVKVALLLPPGTVTLAGTLAAALLLERLTSAPPVGAGPLSVTVPVEDCAPPVTLVGLKVSEEAAGITGTAATGTVIVCPLVTCTCEMNCPP